MDFREYIVEAKMSNDEVLKACEALVKTGDDKAKEFAQGLIDYYEKEGSFHPNQVSGLQNIMKNASFQLAEGITKHNTVITNDDENGMYLQLPNEMSDIEVDFDFDPYSEDRKYIKAGRNFVKEANDAVNKLADKFIKDAQKVLDDNAKKITKLK